MAKEKKGACLLTMTKESACNAGDLSLIPGWEDPLEKGTATQLQYSGLGNIVHGVARSWR